MGAKEEIRDAGAEAALVVALELGVALKFSQAADAAWTDLLGIILESERVVGGRHGEGTDEESIVFCVPRQTGFPPAAGVLTGAVVRYDGNDYEVEHATPDGSDFDYAATFTLTCGRFLEGTAEVSEAPA